jgi:hypothetical protein
MRGLLNTTVVYRRKLDRRLSDTIIAGEGPLLPPMDATLTDILRFLHHIGIPTTRRKLPDSTFLPGLTLHGSGLLIDPARLAHPGDLLHEAGHFALTPAAERPRLSIETTFTLGDDIGAIAWSYAAIISLGLDPSIVFHDGGYRGNSRAYIENFALGRYVGVCLLEWPDSRSSRGDTVRA